MVPEFISRNGSEPMTRELEELTCWENQVVMLMCFNRLGYKNIIASDIDDLRAADIPIVFKGTDFITIKLVCSNLYQIQEQMRNRPNNGLIDFELQKKINEKNILPFRNCVHIENEPINIHCRQIFYNQIYTLEFMEVGYVFRHSVFKE